MKRLLVFFLPALFFGWPMLSQTLKPTAKMALLLGKVTNMKGRALPGEIILFVDEKSKQEFRATSAVNGTFELLVPAGAAYNLKYKNFTLDMQYTRMEIPADPEATYEVEVQIEPPRSVVLENVFFDTGKSSLRPTSFKALNDLAEVLKTKSTMVVEIQGHTDNVGTEESNLALSQARADEVKKYLVQKGVGADRVLAKGYGAGMPVADNSSEQGRAKNRRTQLKIVKD
jgi:OmpA-OmpF porin, OOP family